MELQKKEDEAKKGSGKRRIITPSNQLSTASSSSEIEHDDHGASQPKKTKKNLGLTTKDDVQSNFMKIFKLKVFIFKEFTRINSFSRLIV